MNAKEFMRKNEQIYIRGLITVNFSLLNIVQKLEDFRQR